MDEKDATTARNGIEKPSFPVILAGLATTALTLFGVFLLEIFAPEVNIMGWYANHILPIGAMLVGIVAASGYGIVSYFTGTKISKQLLWTVLALQLLAYFAAQYIEYRGLSPIHENGTSVGFFEYFDLVTRSFVWKEKYGNAVTPLGEWGYLLRLAEVGGFCVGSLGVPMILRATPFCERCQRYMKKKNVAYIPASVPAAGLFTGKDNKAAQAAASQAAATEAQAQIAQFSEWARENRAYDFKDAVKSLAQQKGSANLPTRIAIEVIRCPACEAGRVRFVQLTGQGRDTKRKEISATPVSGEFIRTLL